MRKCIICGREFSRKQEHVRCKRCRPTEKKYDGSAKQRFRRSIRDRARHIGTTPMFANFTARLRTWENWQREYDRLKLLLARIEVC